ncbi:MAG: isoprenylcysteine carboxylmethyltransferase family protein [Ekhidna sp.]
MKLKIPPFIVFFLSLGIIFGIHYLTRDLRFTFIYQTTLSRVFLALGVLLAIAGIVAFRTHGTTVDPLHPDKVSNLVTGGVYKYSRNPMYLGMALVLLGGVIRIGNPVTVLGLAFFVWYLTRYQIKPEEETLLTKYGDEFKAYCSKVGRWI